MDQLAQLLHNWSVPLVPEPLPGFVRNLSLTVAVACVVGAALAARLGVRHRALAMAWLTCLLAPLAYTLSSTGRQGAPSCDMSWVPWTSPIAWMAADTRWNVMMMIPAGAAAVLLPAGERRLAALATALALPVLIEGTQMLVGNLGRGCQLGDVINNQIGVVIGFSLASAAGMLVQSWRLAHRGAP